VGQSLKLPKRHGPLLFGVIQSCVTCAIAAAVAHSADTFGAFAQHWVKTWFLSWVMTLPIVVLAAPSSAKSSAV